LTKQFLQQIPLSKYNFIIDSPDHTFTTSTITSLSKEKLSKFKFNGQLIGWVNIHLESEGYIAESLGKYLYSNSSDSQTYLILFIDNEGDIKRGYMDINLYSNLFDKTYPQIYI